MKDFVLKSLFALDSSFFLLTLFMEQFDVIVVGSGSGMLVASAAVEQGFKVALVEQGKMGGTCINVGCVPSKMLVYPADILVTMQTA